MNRSYPANGTVKERHQWLLEDASVEPLAFVDDTVEGIVVTLLRELRVWKEMNSINLQRVAALEKQLATSQTRYVALVDELRALRKGAAA